MDCSAISNVRARGEGAGTLGMYVGTYSSPYSNVGGRSAASNISNPAKGLAPRAQGVWAQNVVVVQWLSMDDDEPDVSLWRKSSYVPFEPATAPLRRRQLGSFAIGIYVCIRTGLIWTRTRENLLTSAS